MDLREAAETACDAPQAPDNGALQERHAPAPDPFERLEWRLGQEAARRRLEIERRRQARRLTRPRRFFRLKTWYSAHGLIRNALRFTGLYRRGERNAEHIEIRHNPVALANLPAAFDGITILHLTDLHVETSRGALARLDTLLGALDYDLCVLTGDYRAATSGPFAATLEGLARLRGGLKGPVFGVLGNHDTILMVPGMEDLGISVLINDRVTLRRGAARLHLAGIDDAHRHRAHDIAKAAAAIPPEDCAILLSHTPEVFREAARAGFDLMLSGHTHGGQICLPGRVAVTLEAALPRHMGAGAWRHRQMIGYTSKGIGSCIVPVRFNCRPEITLHHLSRG